MLKPDFERLMWKKWWHQVSLLSWLILLAEVIWDKWRRIKSCCTLYILALEHSSVRAGYTGKFVYKHLRLCHFQLKCSHELIKIMHSLDPIPCAQLSAITPQYLLKSHLLHHGLELLHSWQTASVLDSNTPLVNYVCFPFFFPFLPLKFG